MLNYIDTNVLLEFAKFGDSPNDDALRIFRDELYGKEVKIPQIVLGEAFTLILEHAKSVEEMTTYLQNIHHALGRFKAIPKRFPSLTTNIVTQASNIRKVDDRMEYTDSLILAHAIEDDTATHFHTKDKAFRNQSILDYLCKLKGKNTRSQRLNVPLY